jgi:hypothetical protein
LPSEREVSTTKDEDFRYTSQVQVPSIYHSFIADQSACFTQEKLDDLIGRINDRYGGFIWLGKILEGKIDFNTGNAFWLVTGWGSSAGIIHFKK